MLSDSPSEGATMPGQVPPISDERDLLLAYIEQQRESLRISAYGLTDEQAGLAPSASALCVGGLIKHVAATERHWIEMARGVPHRRNEEEYGSEFLWGAGDTLAAALAEYAEVARETEEAVAELPLDHPVPVPKGVPWFPDDVDAWSFRWVLLHVIEETAKHAGHADIVRESIDGATFYELMAGAEGWPATDWLTPWTPPKG
jgi:uncharacterized damage-inducible protein DinB